MVDISQSKIAIGLGGSVGIPHHIVELVVAVHDGRRRRLGNMRLQPVAHLIHDRQRTRMRNRAFELIDPSLELAREVSVGTPEAFEAGGAPVNILQCDEQIDHAFADRAASCRRGGETFPVGADDTRRAYTPSGKTARRCTRDHRKPHRRAAPARRYSAALSARDIRASHHARSAAAVRAEAGAAPTIYPGNGPDELHWNGRRRYSPIRKSFGSPSLRSRMKLRSPAISTVALGPVFSTFELLIIRFFSETMTADT